MRRALFGRAMVIAVTVTVGGAAAAAGTTAAGASPRAAVAAGHRAASRTQPVSRVRAGSIDKGRMCITGPILCAEVADPESAFGEGVYVGHDQPAVLYSSSRNGAGNRNRWQLTLPKDPPSTVTAGRSWSFQLEAAFWLGMALCDTQSYPLQVSTCTPDSDTNITPLAMHPGTAQMELQFYPPGFVEWPSGQSCDPTRWCAAMTISSLSENPITGQILNPTCQAQVGAEYMNFAFVTMSGAPIAPPGPVDSTLATFTPQNPDTFFMNPGDRVRVTTHDTATGLQVILNDQTTRQNGSMTASAANGFGQVQFDPTGTSCNQIPFDFHPMYATSSPQTRVPWEAHSGNITFAEDIGHFDYCTTVGSPGGVCSGMEGITGDQEPADADDTLCFPATNSSLVQVSGCLDRNVGFDGTSYQRDWPNGHASLHPTAGLFSSPLTGPRYGVNYPQAAFETDTPRVETSVGMCNQTTGTGCTIVPPTDDTGSAAFYPFFSVTSQDRPGGCRWFLGDAVPRLTARDFGGIFQYGSLLPQQYLTFGGGGATETQFNDYQQAFTRNPCPLG